MNTKLNVVRFENEDVIATSGILLCDRDDHKKVTFNNETYFNYTFTRVQGDLGADVKIRINGVDYSTVNSSNAYGHSGHVHLANKATIPNETSYNSNYYILVDDHYEICDGIHAE